MTTKTTAPTAQQLREALARQQALHPYRRVAGGQLADIATPLRSALVKLPAHLRPCSTCSTHDCVADLVDGDTFFQIYDITRDQAAARDDARRLGAALKAALRTWERLSALCEAEAQPFVLAGASEQVQNDVRGDFIRQLTYDVFTGTFARDGEDGKDRPDARDWWSDWGDMVRDAVEDTIKALDAALVRLVDVAELVGPVDEPAEAQP